MIVPLFGLLGPVQLGVVLLVLLLLFGSSLPRLMRSMGQGVNEFKKGIRESEHETTAAKKSDDAQV